MLAETLEYGVFSHVVVNTAFEKYKPEARDRAFISRLYQGVLERLIYLDFCINRVSKTKTVKMKPAILNILRTGAYQLLFMDQVPDRAAVHEAGRLAEKRGFKELKPFVNGVLRSIQRDGRERAEAEMPANIRLSVPKWMYEMLCSQYGTDVAERFLENALAADSALTIRLNTAKASAEEIISALEAEGCTVKALDERGDCFSLDDFGSITGLSAYGKGLFSVQDRSSVRAALAGCRELKKMNVTSPLIVDVCAAPGGKSICAAQEFKEGCIIARDLSPKKAALINDNIERLGLTNIKSEVHDALVTDAGLVNKADMVIADLPCSGIGVIGNKPDIKFRLKKKDLEGLTDLQADILDTVSGYVRKGGLLLFSTCTINKDENSGMVSRFLESHSFELIREETMLEGGDGFYVAVMRRK